MRSIVQARSRAPVSSPRALTARAYAPSAPRSQAVSTRVSNTSYSQFPLDIGSIAVWWVNPEQVPRSVVERYAHWLSYGELDYICSAPKSAEQHARLCSRVLMRSVIATCLGQGVRLSDLTFVNTEHGKPELDCQKLPKRARFLDFNLTDTPGLQAVAVAAGVKIGIDCERIDRAVRFAPERIARKMFSSTECAQLQGVADGDGRVKRFLRQWTAKEAHVKATARGLYAGRTKDFSIVDDGEVAAEAIEHLSSFSGLRIEQAPTHLAFESELPEHRQHRAGYVGSLCLELERDDGEPQSRGWEGLSVAMFEGFPGYPEPLEAADAVIVAAT